jgi:hypothetical protein
MWLEDAEDLDSAESRIRELVSYWPGEFQILDQDSHRIVATVSGETGQCHMSKKQLLWP